MGAFDIPAYPIPPCRQPIRLRGLLPAGGDPVIAEFVSSLLWRLAAFVFCPRFLVFRERPIFGKAGGALARPLLFFFVVIFVVLIMGDTVTPPG